MLDLKDQLIKLGDDRPELREHIRPVLQRLSSLEKTSAPEVSFDAGNLSNKVQKALKDFDSVSLARDRRNPITVEFQDVRFYVTVLVEIREEDPELLERKFGHVGKEIGRETAMTFNESKSSPGQKAALVFTK